MISVLFGISTSISLNKEILSDFIWKSFISLLLSRELNFEFLFFDGSKRKSLLFSKSLSLKEEYFSDLIWKSFTFLLIILLLLFFFCNKFVKVDMVLIFIFWLNKSNFFVLEINFGE